MDGHNDAMTSYPGDPGRREDEAGSDSDPASDAASPDQPADATGEASAADAAGPPPEEPTQPVGYWERQAAEQARAQEQQGHPEAGDAAEAPPSGWVSPSVPPAPGAPPSSGQAPPAQPGYGQAPPGQSPYGQAPYGQAPYGQSPYGQAPSGPAPYGAPGAGGPPPTGPGYPPPGPFAPAPPAHPQSTLAMVLGIVGLVGGFIACGLGLVLSPFAWALGRNALRDIRASQGRVGGEGPAKTGMITGIIGTVLLVLAVLAVIAFAVLVAVSESGSGNI